MKRSMVWLAAVIVAAMGSLAFEVGQAAATVAPLGIHDGSINKCDNSESWNSDGSVTPITPQNAQAAQAVLAPGGSWFSNLNAHTVRVSVPWDIALPDSGYQTNGRPDSTLVVQHDTNSQWASSHLAALTKEQSCLDWWLSAASHANVTVQIAFKPDYDYRNFDSSVPGASSNAILAPSGSVYNTAIHDFVAEYSKCFYGVDSSGNNCLMLSGSENKGGPANGRRVTIISPWGEPDLPDSGAHGNSLPGGYGSHATGPFRIPGGSTLDNPNCSSQATNYCGPVLAAQYYMRVLKRCEDIGIAGKPNATQDYCELSSGTAKGMDNSGIVAGDYSDLAGQTEGSVAGITGSQAYWRTYFNHLNYSGSSNSVTAHTWGLHPYTDVTDYEFCTGTPGYSYPPPNNYQSKTEHMENDLLSVGIGALTNSSLWLNEISVFHIPGGAGGRNPPQGRCAQGTPQQLTSFSPRRQAFAFLFLDGAGNAPTLGSSVTAGGAVPAGGAPVDRLYYLRAYVDWVGNATYIHPNNQPAAGEPTIVTTAATCLANTMGALSVKC